MLPKLLAVASRLVFVDGAGERRFDQLRRPDVPAEGDCPPHGCLVVSELVAVDLGEGTPAADHLGGLLESQITAFREAPLEAPGGSSFRYGEYDHLVVGEQSLVHGVAEADLVEKGPVELLVIHRAEEGGNRLGLSLGAGAVDLRRGSHVEPAGCLDLLVVVDGQKVRRIVLAGYVSARSPVRLVADRQIEPLQALSLDGLCRFDDRRGLIGGEDRCHCIGGTLSDVERQLVGVRHRRQRQVHRVHVDPVVLARPALADLGVRTDGEAPEPELGIVRPFLDGLGHQGQARHQIEDTTACADEFLGYA